MLAYGDLVTSSKATVISTYNTELRTRVSTFETANSGTTTYYVFDTQVPFNTTPDAPATYGATNATFFNADGTTCLWYNDLHPGQAIQKLVAQGVAKQVAGSFFRGVNYGFYIQHTRIFSRSNFKPNSRCIACHLICKAIVTPVSSTANMPSSSVILASSTPVATLSSASSVVSAAASSTAVALSGDDECEA
ncbi:hypothetical protein EAF00_007687 [Botryotinia globosa]|nr:hypothetical protein EAF00_007687 [Botryotinia globosa]